MKTTVKRVLKILKKGLIGFFAFLSIYVLIALLLSYIPVNRSKYVENGPKTLYASTNGVHVDLIVPVADMSPKFREQLQPAPEVQFIGFGWGDRKFYLETPTWGDLTVYNFMNSFFWPSSSLVHVTYHQSAFKNWEQLSASEDQVLELCAALESGFKTDEANGFTELPGKGYYDNDTFFEGAGSYTLFRTCNVWTNQKMKQAGLPAVLWTPFPWPVMGRFE
ncbi:MAG: DUF2459 domain-containing protein [Bacteroidota bacterium]